MADEQESAPAKPASKLPWILLLAVLVAGAGGIAFLTVRGGADPDVRRYPKSGPMLEMSKLIANLNEPGGARYLKLSVMLELNHPATRALQDLLPRLHDRALVYISTMTVEQVQAKDFKLAMKKELTKMANEVFGEGTVKTAYFKEFVMQ